MGHRARLLEGAKKCLNERGFARTTARDVVAASGTNLGSIGYHFGSMEALLVEALFAATEEWAAELEAVLPVGEDPVARFEAVVTQISESFSEHRMLWVATFEALGQLEHSPELRERLATVYQEVRVALTALFQGIDEGEVDDRSARTLGSFYYALVIGLLTQWTVDPERAPSGSDIAEALRRVAAWPSVEGKAGL